MMQTFTKYMFQRPSGIALCVVGLGIAAAAGLIVRDYDHSFFDPQKMEAASKLGTPVPISAILPIGVETICIVGPYSSAEYELTEDDPKLTKQIDPSAVDEGHVRVALFDSRAMLLNEHDLRRGRNRYRIQADGIGGAFCQNTAVLLTKVVSQDGFTTVQFIR